MSAVNGSGGLSYENSDLNELTRRQLNEDISAYRYDVQFSTDQLSYPQLTPGEARTLQLRILDLGHQIRHCQHRLELIEAQARNNGGASVGRAFSTQFGRPVNGTPAMAGIKRPRMSKGKMGDSDNEDLLGDVEEIGSTSVQRLGFWKCHLCTSEKYLLAGGNRVPSAPCKWPLKDVSKMMNHFLDMHTEQDPEDRCMELGSALDKNRGPFQYWLSRTRNQNLGDGALVNNIIATLLTGQLPHQLRKLNRAASVFPNKGPSETDDA